MTVRKAFVIASLVLAVLPGSIAALAAPGDIWLSDFFLFRVRTAASGFTLEQRANEIQIRANDLLQNERQIPPVTLAKVGNDVNIYAGCRLFVTVTPADAAVNGTNVDQLAEMWAQRLRMTLPRAASYLPGVGTCPLP